MASCSNSSFIDFPNVTQVRESLFKIKKKLECPICLELLSDPYMTLCSHPFCRACIYKAISSNKGAQCPLCKLMVTKRSLIENRQLSEIIDSVKELEEVIIRATGKERTPPRVLHTHEGTGTPGLLLHSLAHPSPSKPEPSTSAKVSNVENEDTSVGRYPKRKCKGCTTPNTLLTDTAEDRTTTMTSSETATTESGPLLRRPVVKRRRKALLKSSRRANKCIPPTENRQELLTALKEGALRDTNTSGCGQHTVEEATSNESCVLDVSEHCSTVKPASRVNGVTGENGEEPSVVTEATHAHLVTMETSVIYDKTNNSVSNTSSLSVSNNYLTGNDILVLESPISPHHSHLLPPTQPLTVADSLPVERASKYPYNSHTTCHVDGESPLTPSLSSPELSTQELRRLMTEKEREVLALEAMLRVTTSTSEDGNNNTVSTSPQANYNANSELVAKESSPQLKELKTSDQESDNKLPNDSPQMILETQFTEHSVTQEDRGHKEQRRTIETIQCDSKINDANNGSDEPSTKRARLLIELNSDDIESYSPLTHFVDLSPLPDDHPFMSVSTTSRPPLPDDHPFMSVSTTPRPPDSVTLSTIKKTVEIDRFEQCPVTPTSAVSRIVETPVLSLGGFPSPGGVVRPTLSLVGSGLTKAQLRQAQIFARREGGRIASVFNSHTTHVVVCVDSQGLCPRTMKYLLGLLARVWLVSFHWVEECLKEGKLLPEDPYEVRGDKTLTDTNQSIPIKARFSRMREEPGLFSLCVFYLHCNCKGLTKDQLSQLVCMGGGEVVESVSSDSVTVCDCKRCEGGTPVITSSDMLDTISSYKPVDITLPTVI